MTIACCALFRQRLQPHPGQELPMSTEVISPLRQRMIEDMNARKLGAHSQRSHIQSCKRFSVFLKRSPDTATADDIRRFHLHLMAAGWVNISAHCY
jgi:Phage integrase, N-terminal SAM-like domain